MPIGIPIGIPMMAMRPVRARSVLMVCPMIRIVDEGLADAAVMLVITKLTMG